MNDWQLRVFVSVCVHGSMNAAAHELMTTPVTVKNQVDALERELGAALLVRSPLGCAPTPQGMQALDVARSVLTAVEHLRQDVNGQHVIRVCETKDLPHAFQDVVAMELESRDPSIKVERVFLPRSQWEGAVAVGKADACQILRGAMVDGIPDELVSLTACLPNTQAIRYPTTFRAVCLVSPFAPEAKQGEIPPVQLSGREVLVDSLMFEPGCLDQLFRMHGVSARAEDAIENHGFAVEACRAGAVIVTAEMFSNLYLPLVAVPLQGYHTWITLLTRTDMPAHVQAYIDASKRQFAQMLG